MRKSNASATHFESIANCVRQIYLWNLCVTWDLTQKNKQSSLATLWWMLSCFFCNIIRYGYIQTGISVKSNRFVWWKLIHLFWRSCILNKWNCDGFIKLYTNAAQLPFQHYFIIWKLLLFDLITIFVSFYTENVVCELESLFFFATKLKAFIIIITIIIKTRSSIATAFFVYMEVG